jgi:hypothetical protein
MPQPVRSTQFGTMAKISKRQKKFAASGGLKSTIKKRRQIKQNRPKPKDPNARPAKDKKAPALQKEKNVRLRLFDLL